MAKQNHIEQGFKDITENGWESFPDKEAFLIDFNTLIDNKLEHSFAGEFSNKDGFKDRLFEILMERFDLIEDYKDGLKIIAKSLAQTPLTFAHTGKHLEQSMVRMIELAGFDMECPIRRKVRAVGLLTIYADTVRVWLKDDTADLSKTMAHLDRRLSQAEGLANLLAL